CTFPAGWAGSWFQSGSPALIAINSTHIHSKGECYESESYDKFLLYDRREDCYRCMVILEKHKYVLQYKETFCSEKDSMSSICESISGDAPLYSMFRKEPRPEPQPCPFHPAPFTFTYSRGSGDCANPPSRAEACTDDSRLLLRYMACPDVPGTESNVEELVCLATWKEGSTRYLVGQISQVQRRNSIASDEDTFRCFVYKGQHGERSMTYNIAQSGDATCNGLSSPTDGSRIMKLTNSDDEHNRCHFPAWIVEHHKWFSLDHAHQYHFTTKNATLKIMSEIGAAEERRLVCHSILEQRDNRYIKLVAHVTRGCESGHVCLQFHRRDGGVLELQQGAALWDAPQDACAGARAADPALPYLTLVTAAPAPARCPLLGRYTVLGALPDTRRRRQHARPGEAREGAAGSEGAAAEGEECVPGRYHSLSAGCGAAGDAIEFRSHCTSATYTCHAAWQDSGRGYLVASPLARASSHPRTLCFVYPLPQRNESRGGALALSAVTRTCDRRVQPGRTGDKAYNLTANGNLPHTALPAPLHDPPRPRLTPRCVRRHVRAEQQVQQHA
ncbi:hypothetical protein RR46_12267, partial [Papilio xuthus]